MNTADDTTQDEPAAQEVGEENELESEIHSHKVGKRVRGRRLDKFLQGRHPRVSRTVLQRYIKQGLVTVNGMPTKASYEPAAGDLVQIKLPPPPPSELIPEDIPLTIIFEDKWLMVINKQPGIVCHPAHGTQSGTIANAAAFHAEQLSRGSDPFRPGIVHRLDKNTSGIMLIAKCDEAHWRIALQFERRTVKKEYFAICEGEIALDADIINKPLAPHPNTTQRMVMPTANPPRQAMFKEAITEFHVNTRYRGYTTVDLFPKTGRTHQLRVHMSSIGHPMLGDGMYGGWSVSERELSGEGSTSALISHQALHARRLKIMHPILETPLELEAPLPEYLQRIIDLLELHRTRG